MEIRLSPQEATRLYLRLAPYISMQGTEDFVYNVPDGMEGTPQKENCYVPPQLVADEEMSMLLSAVSKRVDARLQYYKHFEIDITDLMSKYIWMYRDHPQDLNDITSRLSAMLAARYPRCSAITSNIRGNMRQSLQIRLIISMHV